MLKITIVGAADIFWSAEVCNMPLVLLDYIYFSYQHIKSSYLYIIFSRLCINVFNTLSDFVISVIKFSIL